VTSIWSFIVSHSLPKPLIFQSIEHLNHHYKKSMPENPTLALSGRFLVFFLSCLSVWGAGCACETFGGVLKFWEKVELCVAGSKAETVPRCCALRRGEAGLPLPEGHRVSWWM
jgi:hypothetical protein